MSTIRRSRAKADPFRFGWREVRYADGRMRWVPLSERDILHPREGDHIVQLPLHGEDWTYLVAAFRDRVAGRTDVFVGGDFLIDFNIPGRKPYAPDVAVILGLAPDFNEIKLDLARTGARPAILVEITSPSTRNNDLRAKMEGYARGGVETYVILDVRVLGGVREVKLTGHRLVDGAYQPIPLDDQGRIRLGEPLDAWLTVVDGRPLCLDGVTGAPVERDPIVRQARWAAEERARAAEARVDAEVEARRAAESRAAEAEAKVRAIEAELERLRGGG